MKTTTAEKRRNTRRKTFKFNRYSERKVNIQIIYKLMLNVHNNNNYCCTMHMFTLEKS